MHDHGPTVWQEQTLVRGWTAQHAALRSSALQAQLQNAHDTLTGKAVEHGEQTEKKEL